VVVEDGTGLPLADSYVSEDYLDAYIDARAITLASGDAEAALVRATAAIDARYAGAFPGYRLAGRSQGLEWPRQNAWDAQGWLIPDNIVPVEVLDATCEAAIRELSEPGSMMPDLKRGGAIQSVRAGSVAVTYASNASAQTSFTLIDGIIANVLSGAQSGGGGMFGVAVRG
jgi:hypothetical protein